MATWFPRFAALGAVLSGALLAVPAMSQDPTPVSRPSPRPPDAKAPARNQNQALRDAGRTAQTGSGKVGKRQSAADTARVVFPLGRLSTRVQNRVQSRIRNRIDENYDPAANAASPFEVAAERARSVGRPPRR